MEVPDKKDVLVKYFKPSCVHCKKLESTWQQVEDTQIPGVHVKSVNTDDHPMELDGVPSIHLIQGTRTHKYNGKRDIDHILAWAEGVRKNNHCSTDLKSPQQLSSMINASLPTIVKFSTPECPHCINAIQPWNSLHMDSANLLNIDVSVHHHMIKDIMVGQHSVADMYMNGVPSVWMFCNNTASEYKGRISSDMHFDFKDAVANGGFSTTPMAGGGKPQATTSLTRCQKLNARGLQSLIASTHPAIISFDDGREHPALHNLFSNRMPGTSIVRVNLNKYSSDLHDIQFPDGSMVTEKAHANDFIVLDGKGGAHNVIHDDKADTIRNNAVPLLLGRPKSHSDDAMIARELYMMECKLKAAEDDFNLRVNQIRSDTATNKLLGGGSGGTDYLDQLIKNMPMSDFGKKKT